MRFVQLHPPPYGSLPLDRLWFTATLLDDPRHVYVYEGAHYSTGGDEQSFITGFILPRAGKWALVVTSGPDWGCFLLTLGG